MLKCRAILKIVQNKRSLPQMKLNHDLDGIQIEISINYTKTLTKSEAEDIAINSLISKTKQAVLDQEPELIEQQDAELEDPLEELVDGLLTMRGPILENMYHLIVKKPETQEANLDTYHGEFFDHKLDESWVVYIS